MTTINQKEYLKKYLGIGKAPGEKRRKKKKEKPREGNRLKIIDDDVDVLISKEIEVDLSAANEDAPQIVAVIDERPPSLQVDEKTKSNLWKPIGDPNNTVSDIQSLKLNSFKLNKQGINTDSHSATISIKKESMTGRHGNYANSDNERRRNEVDDFSPRRKNKTHHSPIRREIKKEDNSPPRRGNKDSSPPRKQSVEKESSYSDHSPIRREMKKEDNSPPRRGNKDSSPPRKQSVEIDSSPARRRNKERDSPRRVKNKKEETNLTNHRGGSKRKGERLKRTRWNSEEPSEPSVFNRMKTTLDGKQAGLQNAEDLVKESKYIRQKEDEMFHNMSAEISGRNAATVIRAKKNKNVEEEAAKEKRQKEIKEKYDQWGKGLKQVEDQNKKAEEQLHEMSKPLARYADDEDLEKFLKEQERDGDPMLAYIRKKKRKEKIAAGIPGMNGI